MAIIKPASKKYAAGTCPGLCVFVSLLFAALGVGQAADAGGGGSRWIEVTVTSIAVCTSCAPKGSVIVGLSAAGGGSPPSCSSSYRDRVIVDVSTAAGAFAAQLFQHSAETGARLMVVGTGTCDFDSRFETLSVVSELIATTSNQSP